MSSRRSCGSLPCAPCGRRECDAAPSPPHPPAAGGASRPLPLPSAQRQTSARASERCPEGGPESRSNQLKQVYSRSLRPIHFFRDSPCRWRGLLSVVPPACLCVERRWPAPAARGRTQPRGEPAAESQASPPRPAKNPTLTVPDFSSKHWWWCEESTTKTPTGQRVSYHCLCRTCWADKIGFFILKPSSSSSQQKDVIGGEEWWRGNEEVCVCWRLRTEVLPDRIRSTIAMTTRAAEHPRCNFWVWSFWWL